MLKAIFLPLVDTIRGWRLVAVLAVIAGVAVMADAEDEADWASSCAAAGTGSRMARWHAPASLEFCDGRRVELAGVPKPEHQCRWLSLASSLGVVLDARRHRGGYWELRPTREFSRSASRVRWRPVRYGPDDVCELDERR